MRTKTVAMNLLMASAMGVVLAAAPAAADPFCATLAKIAASAPNDFAGVRGKPESDYDPQASSVMFMRVLSLPGALTKPSGAHCYVDQADPNVETGAEGHFFYTCYFAGTGDARTDVGALATKVAACLGQPAPAIAPSPVAQVPTTDQIVAGIEYNVSPVNFNQNDPIPGWIGVELSIQVPYANP